MSDGRLSTEYVQDKAVTRVQRVVHEAVLAYEEVAESSQKANEHDAKTCYEGLV